MDRKFYLDLAESGLRMPLGTHLVLHEHPDPQAIVLDGGRLGRLLEETARRFRVPLAIPLMDLTLEKEALLATYGMDPTAPHPQRFESMPAVVRPLRLTRKMQAACEAIRHVASATDLVPIGIAVGPFSLLTRLVADPIAPVYLAGAGATAADEPEIALIERLLELALGAIETYVDAQLDAGARAVIVCEPAANTVFFSPNQLAQDYGVFDRYVMRPNLEIARRLRARGADLIFHDCGDLLDGMIRRFARLDPAILSLGSSRILWEDAALLPRDIVLYGNLPTKRFDSDELMSIGQVGRLADELAVRMRRTGHPFILGSECDVLSVPGRERSVMAKVEEFLRRREPVWPLR